MEPPPASEELTWTVHLAARQPGRAVLVAAVILLTGAWAGYTFQSPIGFLMGAGLLTAAVSEFLLPVRYRLTAEYAEARGPLYWRRLEWAEVKRVYVGKQEIKLSPLRHGGPREAFRGVVLRTQDDPEPVLRAVRRFRQARETPDVEPVDAAPAD